MEMIALVKMASEVIVEVAKLTSQQMAKATECVTFTLQLQLLHMKIVLMAYWVFLEAILRRAFRQDFHLFPAFRLPIQKVCLPITEFPCLCRFSGPNRRPNP